MSRSDEHLDSRKPLHGPAFGPSTDDSGLSECHNLAVDPFGALLCWLDIPFPLPAANSRVDYSFVEAIPTFEDQDFCMPASAGSPPDGDGGDQAELMDLEMDSVRYVPPRRRGPTFSSCALLPVSLLLCP